MEAIDIILLVGLLVGGLRGFMRGLVNQLAAVVALLLGLWVATHFSDIVAGWLSGRFSLARGHMAVLSFSLTFAAVVVGVHLVARTVSGLLDMASLGLLNKLAGMVLGLLLLGFVESVVLSVVDGMGVLPSAVKQKSLLYGPVAGIAPVLFPYLRFDELQPMLDQMRPQPSNNGVEVLL